MVFIVKVSLSVGVCVLVVVLGICFTSSLKAVVALPWKKFCFIYNEISKDGWQNMLRS